MEKKRLLFWGDDPAGATGYSRQARNILTRLSRYFDIAVIAINRIDESPHDPFTTADRLPFKIYRAGIEADDPEGLKLLPRVFPALQPDVFMFMGDLWSFRNNFGPWLEKMHMERPFKSIGYFSTEYPPDGDDRYLLSITDYAITHSRWGMGYENGAGYEEIKKNCDRIIYIPDSVDPQSFYPVPEDQRVMDRIAVGLKPEQFVITNVNRNFGRKDLSATIRAFKRVKAEVPNAHLYLHTAAHDTWYRGEQINLLHLCDMLSLKVGFGGDSDVSFPENFLPSHGYPDSVLNRIYNCADLVVSSSVSEGFGVTPIESLFAGIPILIPGHTGFSNLCDICGIDPVRSYTGVRESVAPVPVHPIDEDDLVNRIMDVHESYKRPDFKLSTMRQSDRARAAFSSDLVFEKYWKPIVDDIYNRGPKKRAILFAQHSSAGDVFLTTSCFDGLRARHPGEELHYMTCSPFKDIVEGLVDRAITFQPSLVHEYEHVYKPHDDHVLRGNWGTGDTPLYELYARIIGLEPTPTKIVLKDPGYLVGMSDFITGPGTQFKQSELGSFPEKYLVVHTTSHAYRTYKKFHFALEGCILPIIQIGAKDDVLVEIKPLIDLRGKLSFRESAWVIAHATGFLGIDSYPAHIAGAHGIPSVVVFGSGHPRVTGPRTTGQAVAFIQPDYVHACPVVGPCWGNIKGCHAPCIDHDPAVIRKAIMRIIPEAFPHVGDVLLELLANQRKEVSV